MLEDYSKTIQMSQGEHSFITKIKAISISQNHYLPFTKNIDLIKYLPQPIYFLAALGWNPQVLRSLVYIYVDSLNAKGQGSSFKTLELGPAQSS